MACPSCGSTSYTLVAQGVAQCQGVVAVPTGAHPSGAMGPTTQTMACGTRYQVPVQGNLGVCSCGMGAVAACTICGTPVCLDHAGRLDGKIACVADLTRAVTESRAEAERAEQAAWERFTAALEAARQRGLSGPGARKASHFVTAYSSNGYRAEVGTSGDVPQKVLDTLQPGSECPTHRGMGCVVESVDIYKSGMFRKKAFKATCVIELWPLQDEAHYRGLTSTGTMLAAGPNGVQLMASMERQALFPPRHRQGQSVADQMNEQADLIESWLRPQ